MLFSSLEFLFLFLPVSTAVYFIIPQRWRNLWLFIGGIAFYAWGEVKYLPVMLICILLNFIFGFFIGRLKSGKAAKILLIAAIIFNVGQLAFFKFNKNAELPVGISFYTFQAMSYVFDVYGKKVEYSKSFIDFGAYVSLYPQLIAGPIVKYSQINGELKNRKVSLEDMADGLRIFCIGLGKKVLLANPSGELWNVFSQKQGFVDGYMGVLFFAMQIYFDFSGYSDMAVGLGRIFGFSFPQNFNYPYISKSITEFWRRWHITLSSFFKEYVYIPLGGNRRGKLITYRNLLITWALTGIWHGASLNFLVWGLYFAVILIAEKAFLGKIITRLPKALQHLYALLLIGIGWIIFSADGSYMSPSEGVRYILRLFGFGCNGFCSEESGYEILRNLIFIIILIFGATPLTKRAYERIIDKIPAAASVLATAVPTVLFLLSVAYIVNSGYNPFLYFRF